jgi:PAS domain S-box-containing protein
MHRLTYLFQKGRGKNNPPLDTSNVATDLERRKKFLRSVNRGWLVFGIVTLVSLPFFPKLRNESIFLIAVTFPTYLIVRFLNLSGRTRLAGIVFSLCVNFSLYGLFMVLVGQLGAYEAFQTESTVWLLMGLAVLFAGAFVDKWAAPGLAAFNALLLIGTRYLIAPNSDPRPSALVFWGLLALTIWLYENTLDQALAKVLGDLKERKRADDEIRKRAETITALYETTCDLVIERDLAKLLQIIVERAARLLNAAGGGLYLCEPESSQVRCIVSYNTPSDFTGTVLKYGEGAAGRVAQTMEPLIVNDYSTWEGRATIYENERPFSAVLSVPMKWQNEAIGVIHVLEFQKEHHFTNDDLNLVTSFANQAAIAVHNARMYGLVQQELTERKLVESALLESELRFSTVFRASPMWISVTDFASGKFILVNDAFSVMSGYSREEAIGRTTGELKIWIEPHDRERLVEILNKERHVRDFETRLLTKTGEIRDVLMSSELIDLSGQLCIVSLTYDITERKRAEETLRESEKQYRSLFENMLEGYAYCKMLFVDNMAQDFIYIDVNPAFQMLTGLQNIVGQRVSQVIPGIQESNPELFEIYGRVSLTGQPERFETYLPALNIWFSISVFCPAKEYFVAVFDNITERKHFEESLQKLNAELEGHVAQRTSQLEAANKELEAFSYSVSHDLRAPLRSIDGFSQILMEDHASELSGEALHYLEVIRGNSQRMHRLIDDLLMLSRVTRHVLRYAVVDLSSLVRVIVSELRDSAPERSTEFIIATGLVVQGDPGLLQIVMQNLLNNAWKFTGKREHARIEFGSNLQADGSRVYFVCDNGAGFNPEYAEKLFGAFQRLHSESEFEGSGIGLATVQRIISHHGGKIWAIGEVEKGATFYFTLGPG